MADEIERRLFLLETKLGTLHVNDRITILETRFDEFRRALDDRLGKLNELREQVTSDREQYLRTDVYDARHRDLRTQVEVIDKQSETRHEALQKELLQRIESNYANLSDKISPLEAAQSRMIGIGVAFMAVAGVLGVLAGHFWR